MIFCWLVCFVASFPSVPLVSLSHPGAETLWLASGVLDWAYPLKLSGFQWCAFWWSYSGIHSTSPRGDTLLSTHYIVLFGLGRVVYLYTIGVARSGRYPSDWRGSSRLVESLPNGRWKILPGTCLLLHFWLFTYFRQAMAWFLGLHIHFHQV